MKKINYKQIAKLLDEYEELQKPDGFYGLTEHELIMRMTLLGFKLFLQMKLK